MCLECSLSLCFTWRRSEDQNHCTVSPIKYFVSYYKRDIGPLSLFSCKWDYGNASTLQWKCMIGGLEAVTAGCMWVTVTSRASRTRLSTPAGRASERGPGIYTHNSLSVLWLQGARYTLMHACVCVSAYLCLCNSYYVYWSLCGLGNNVTFNCISITHVFL